MMKNIVLKDRFNDELENVMINPLIPNDDAWSTKIGKNELRDQYVSWVMDLSEWKVFLTLTFREGKYEDVCMKYWYRLVYILNKDLLGKNYSRKVGHSYFDYILGIEKQLRGAYHFHVIANKPLNFSLIHNEWGHECGFVKTEIIRIKSEAVKYITKYICKGGVLEPYKCKINYQPTITPYWWKLDILQEHLFNN